MTIQNIPKIEEFYLNISLYDPIIINNDNKNEVFNLIFTDKSIDCYCPECKTNSVYVAVENRPPDSNIPFKALIVPGMWQVDLENIDDTFIKEFKCAKKNNHRLIYIIQIKDSKLFKIGQSPSLADIKKGDLEKYRKILESNNYYDLNRAVGLFSHGIGVGSFVYLRRIIENYIIKNAYDDAVENSDLDIDLYNKSRAKERIELLKKYLPEVLIDNKNIYSIISKGLHELSEGDCLGYFPVLKDCIELILIDIQKSMEEKKKKEQIEKSINAINEKIK